MNCTKKALEAQRREWYGRFLRAYSRHACIGVPFVLAGALYITYMLSGYALPNGDSLGWIYFVFAGVPTALLAPLPMAWSEMEAYPTQERLQKLAALQSVYAELKKQDQASEPVEIDK